MSKHYIYKLTIGNDLKDYYWYIGQTNKPKTRLNHHKKTCYNKSKKSYHRKLYTQIRKLTGYNKTNFNNFVKMKILTYTDKSNINKLERLLINKKNHYNLNMI